MKLHYYADTDSLYIELNARPSADSREIADGLVVDFDSISGAWKLSRCRRRVCGWAEAAVAAALTAEQASGAAAMLPSRSRAHDGVTVASSALP